MQLPPMVAAGATCVSRSHAQNNLFCAYSVHNISSRHAAAAQLSSLGANPDAITSAAPDACAGLCPLQICSSAAEMQHRLFARSRDAAGAAGRDRQHGEGPDHRRCCQDACRNSADAGDSLLLIPHGDDKRQGQKQSTAIALFSRWRLAINRAKVQVATRHCP